MSEPMDGVNDGNLADLITIAYKLEEAKMTVMRTEEVLRITSTLTLTEDQRKQAERLEADCVGYREQIKALEKEAESYFLTRKEQ